MGKFFLVACCGFFTFRSLESKTDSQLRQTHVSATTRFDVNNLHAHTRLRAEQRGHSRPGCGLRMTKSSARMMPVWLMLSCGVYAAVVAFAALQLADRRRTVRMDRYPHVSAAVTVGDPWRRSHCDRAVAKLEVGLAAARITRHRPRPAHGLSLELPIG